MISFLCRSRGYNYSTERSEVRIKKIETAVTNEINSIERIKLP